MVNTQGPLLLSSPLPLSLSPSLYLSVLAPSFSVCLSSSLSEVIGVFSSLSLLLYTPSLLPSLLPLLLRSEPGRAADPSLLCTSRCPPHHHHHHPTSPDACGTRQEEEGRKAINPSSYLFIYLSIYPLFPSLYSFSFYHSLSLSLSSCLSHPHAGRLVISTAVEQRRLCQKKRRNDPAAAADGRRSRRRRNRRRRRRRRSSSRCRADRRIHRWRDEPERSARSLGEEGGKPEVEEEEEEEEVVEEVEERAALEGERGTLREEGVRFAALQPTECNLPWASASRKRIYAYERTLACVSARASLSLSLSLVLSLPLTLALCSSQRACVCACVCACACVCVCVRERTAQALTYTAAGTTERERRKAPLARGNEGGEARQRWSVPHYFSAPSSRRRSVSTPPLIIKGSMLHRRKGGSV